MDTAFAVHPDFKSHASCVMTQRTFMPITFYRKQKLNTLVSMESELVGADDVSTMILWTKLLMESQGYEIRKNIFYQDNRSRILMENNGGRSSRDRNRAINICYLFLTDQINKGNLTMEYFPTTKMISEFMTKPIEGKLFQKFSKVIMGHMNFSPHYL